MAKEAFLPWGLGRVQDVDRMHAALTRQLKRIEVWERALAVVGSGNAQITRQWLNAIGKFAVVWTNARATVLKEGRSPGTREACSELCDLAANGMLEAIAKLETLMGSRPRVKPPQPRPSYLAKSNAGPDNVAGAAEDFADAAARWNAVSWLCIGCTAMWALQSTRRR